MVRRFTTLWIYTILKRIESIEGAWIWFHYLMDLHYSQTPGMTSIHFDWFHYLMDLHYSQTYLPLTFTILQFHYLMDLHYSQTSITTDCCGAGFTTLWIYTILKLGWPLYQQYHCFTTLWIYTILKHIVRTCRGYAVSLPYGFTLFSNCSFVVDFVVRFHYLMDLHYSQTIGTNVEYAL